MPKKESKEPVKPRAQKPSKAPEEPVAPQPEPADEEIRYRGHSHPEQE